MLPCSQLREERAAKRGEDNAINEKWKSGHAAIKGEKANDTAWGRCGRVAFAPTLPFLCQMIFGMFSGAVTQP